MRQVLARTIDPRPLAVSRVLVGLAALGISFEWAPVLIRASSGQYLALPSFSGIPSPTSSFVAALFLVNLIASVGMVLGFCGRIPSVLIAAIGATALVADQQAYSNHLFLLVVLSGVLAMSGASQAWSLPRSGRIEGVPYWRRRFLSRRRSPRFTGGRLYPKSIHSTYRVKS